jgi:hypothetical protein
MKTCCPARLAAAPTSYTASRLPGPTGIHHARRGGDGGAVDVTAQRVTQWPATAAAISSFVESPGRRSSFANGPATNERFSPFHVVF